MFPLRFEGVGLEGRPVLVGESRSCALLRLLWASGSWWLCGQSRLSGLRPRLPKTRGIFPSDTCYPGWVKTLPVASPAAFLYLLTVRCKKMQVCVCKAMHMSLIGAVNVAMLGVFSGVGTRGSSLSRGDGGWHRVLTGCQC